jgi:hypothetical protein
MGESGYSMMGSSGKATAWYADGRGAVRNIAGARSQAQRFADRLGLKTAEVMQFSNNFYVQLDDTKGKPATEVLVDPQTGTVTLEYGPAMMWNTRYGMMGARSGGMMGGGSGGMMGGGSGGMMGGGSSGMMGGGSSGMMGGGSSGMMGSMGGVPDWTPARGGATGPVSASEARQIANRWLSGQRAGLVAAKPDALPGYFTMDTLKDGKPEGMLSVNERTGAVWYHWWHGRFVAMEG